MKRTLAQLLTDAAKKAESSREITCPHCSQTFTTNWRTDDLTSVGDGNEDDVNEGDRPAEYDDRTITRLNNLARDLAAASDKGSLR